MHNSITAQNRLSWCCVLILLIFLVPVNAKAYGGDIHRAVCDIVWQRLPAEQKYWLIEIIQSSELSRFSTGCAWPDWVRDKPAYQMTKVWHYQDYSDDDISRNATISPDCHQGCLLAAIEHSFRRLQYPNVSQTTVASPLNFSPELSQAEALFFFSHLLVDLHQPLHVGRIEDRGGNQISVIWRDKEYRLHQWWDGRLLTQLNPSWKDELRKYVKNKNFTLDDQTPLEQYLHQWLRESRLLAHLHIYPHYREQNVLSPKAERALARMMLLHLAKSLLRLEALIRIAYSQFH